MTLVLDASLCKNINLMLEFIKAPSWFCLPNEAICNIAIYAGDTTLNSESDQTSDLWQELTSELESDL